MHLAASMQRSNSTAVSRNSYGSPELPDPGGVRAPGRVEEKIPDEKIPDEVHESLNQDARGEGDRGPPPPPNSREGER